MLSAVCIPVVKRCFWIWILTEWLIWCFAVSKGMDNGAVGEELLYQRNSWGYKWRLLSSNVKGLVCKVPISDFLGQICLGSVYLPLICCVQVLRICSSHTKWVSPFLLSGLTKNGERVSMSLQWQLLVADGELLCLVVLDFLTRCSSI